MAEMMDPPAPRGKPAGRPARAPEERAFEARMEVLPSTAAFVAAFCGRNGIGTTDTHALFMRDAGRNAPGAQPRVDYSVWRLDETNRALKEAEQKD